MHHITSRHRGLRATVAGAALGMIVALAPPLPASAAGPADGREILGAGAHVDALYPQIAAGKLTVRTRTPAGVTDPEKTVLHVPDTETSHVTLPKGYEFLGPAGAEAWVTTEAQDPSVVWPGWSFEGIPHGLLKGTIKITYDRFAYAGDATAPAFAVTAPGGFDGTKVSRLIVPGSTFTSVTGEPGSHTHATWTFTASGTYDIAFTVSATLADGTAISDDATVRFVVGDMPATQDPPAPRTDPKATDTLDTLTIVPNKVDAEYFVGQTITLTALSPSAAATDTYRWHTIPPGGGAPVADEKQKTATWTTKPDRAVDGTTIHVERLTTDGAVAETSAPLTLHTRAIPPTTTLTVTADKATYQAGATATFTSAQSPQTEDEHYHWYLRKRGQDGYTWIPESRLADQQLQITPDLDGAEITARLFNTDHSVLAESAPVRITVTGDGVTAPAATVTLTAPKNAYAPGEQATFTAETPTPDAGVEWSVRRNGENPYTVIEGARTTTLTQTVDATWDGAEIRAVIRDAAGTALAESTIPIIHVAQATAPDRTDEGTGTALWILAGSVALVAAIGAVLFAARRRRLATSSK